MAIAFATVSLTACQQAKDAGTAAVARAAQRFVGQRLRAAFAAAT